MASPLALVCGFATIVASTSVRAEPDETKTSEPTETEINGLPLIGGDTDNGFGGGAMGSIAGVDPTVLRHRSITGHRVFAGLRRAAVAVR